MVESSAILLKNLQPGKYYLCLLSKKKVLYKRVKLLWLFTVHYIVHYDEVERKYKRNIVEGNQLREIVQTDRF